MGKSAGLWKNARWLLGGDEASGEDVVHEWILLTWTLPVSASREGRKPPGPGRESRAISSSILERLRGHASSEVWSQSPTTAGLPKKPENAEKAWMQACRCCQCSTSWRLERSGREICLALEIFAQGAERG